VSFAVPLLSDMESYGEYIVEGEAGTVFAYLCGLTEPAWDVVQGIHASLTRSRFSRLRGASSRGCLQWVIGRCLDPLDGQTLNVGKRFMCPLCHSDHIAFGDAVRVGFAELPVASSTRFLSLSPSERTSRVRQLCLAWLQGER
jgi:hypothetical protein